MSEFLVALTLVAVAQVPLLLKLWLDHRERAGGFRAELHRRQIDAFLGLGALLAQVQRNSEILVALFKEGSVPSNESDEMIEGLAKSYLDDSRKLESSIKDTELLFPARLAVEFPKYVTLSTQLWFKAFNLSHSRSAESPGELWREQEDAYNRIVNLMRLVCGSDSLSEATIKQISSLADGKLTLLLNRSKL